MYRAGDPHPRTVGLHRLPLCQLLQDRGQSGTGGGGTGRRYYHRCGCSAGYGYGIFRSDLQHRFRCLSAGLQLLHGRRYLLLGGKPGDRTICHKRCGRTGEVIRPGFCADPGDRSGCHQKLSYG